LTSPRLDHKPQVVIESTDWNRTPMPPELTATYINPIWSGAFFLRMDDTDEMLLICIRIDIAQSDIQP
jgi:hypothetical protein